MDRKRALYLSAGVAAAGGIYAGLRAAARPTPIGEGAKKLRVRYYAHRGLWNSEIPENSMAAFALAADAGYGIELDLNLDANGNVVVFHDDDLFRMTGYHGRINDTPASVLKTLRLAGTQQGIPLFAKVLELIDTAPMIIELKTTPRYRELCEKTLALLGNFSGDYVIESFDPRIVAWFAHCAPHIVRGQLVSRPHGASVAAYGKRWLLSKMLTNRFARPQFIACEKELLNTRAIRACKRAGAAIVVWTARTEKECTTEAADAVIFESYLPT